MFKTNQYEINEIASGIELGYARITSNNPRTTFEYRRFIGLNPRYVPECEISPLPMVSSESEYIFIVDSNMEIKTEYDKEEYYQRRTVTRTSEFTGIGKPRKMEVDYGPWHATTKEDYYMNEQKKQNLRCE